MRLPPLCSYFCGGVTCRPDPRSADLGSLLGVCLGSWGGRLPFWGPFGGPPADLGSLLGVSGPGVEGGRQQLKTSKIAPVSGARPVLPKRFPPSVVAVRGDLLVFLNPESEKNRQITTYNEHRRGKSVSLKGSGAAEGCCC